MKIVVYKNLDEEIIAQWNALWKIAENATIYNSYEWFCVCREALRNENISVYACFEEDELIGILPLVINKVFGIKTVSSLVAEHTVDTPFLFKKYDRRMLKSFFGNVMRAGNLNIMKMDEKVSKLIKEIYPNVLLSLASVNPYLELEKSPLRYTSSSLKYRMRKVNRDNSEFLSFRRFDQKDNLEKHLKDVFEMEANSSKEHTRKGLFSDKRNREIYKSIVHNCREYVEICILYYKNKPISYVFGLLYKDVFRHNQTAYINSYKSLIPGILIISYILESIEIDRIRILDFCEGANSYKERFTPHFHVQYNMFFSKNRLIMVYWKTINLIRRTKQILFPEKYSRDHEFLFKVL